MTKTERHVLCSTPQPSTDGVLPNQNVHFQPIDPAPKSPVQLSNQGIFNPLLNLVDDSPKLPSSSSSRSIPCGQLTPQGSTQTSNSSVHTPVPHAMVPPTPYVNQAAIDQHTGNPEPLLPHVAPVTMAQHRLHQRPFHPKLSGIAFKHPTRCLAAAAHFLIRKKLFNSKCPQLLVAKDFAVAEKNSISLSAEENLIQERKHLRENIPQMLKQQVPNINFTGSATR